MPRKPAAQPDIGELHRLHPEALIGPVEVRALLGGISATSLWRCIQAGTMPAPIMITPKARRWPIHEVRSAIAALKRGWPSVSAAAA